MHEKQKEEMLLSIRDFRLPKYDEIPDVGLFLEQTTKYISKYVEPLQDITLTGSMISNYVKQKIIAKPIKKQYFTDQIAYLIFIAIAKSVLSLDDIHLFIQLQKKPMTLRLHMNIFVTSWKKLFRMYLELENILKSIKKRTVMKKSCSAIRLLPLHTRSI